MTCCDDHSSHLERETLIKQAAKVHMHCFTCAYTHSRDECCSSTIRHSMVVVALQIGRVQLARGLQTASCKAGAASTCACLTATSHHAAPHWCDHGWLLLLLASAAMLCCQLFSANSCTSYHMGATPQAPQESKARCWLCVCVCMGGGIYSNLPVAVWIMMLSPCLSPRPSMCPTIAHAAALRVKASRAASQLPGSGKRESSQRERRGGRLRRTLSSNSARRLPAKLSYIFLICMGVW